ncbi:unnamed protein product [Schistosoma curassoni]|uniref:Uncharacterized protein n=1 Tax=Schistosoma curassoni TaxID=6186 RepID=A0A183JC41_9TREM|nr:unnamed protein product [Schistosoma curassoni]
MGENKPDSSGGRSEEEAVEVSRTHIDECTKMRHGASPHMEYSRPKEKRKTKEHTTPGNGDRHEKNEQEMDGTRREGRGQSVLGIGPGTEKPDSGNIIHAFDGEDEYVEVQVKDSSEIYHFVRLSYVLF